MEIIGFAAQMRVGKDSSADYLQSKLGWKKVSFATALKKIFCDTFEKDLEFIEEWKPKKEAPPGLELPVRQSLQLIGDEFRKIKSSIWIDLALRGTDPRFIPDCRYFNEMKKISDLGGKVVLLSRDGYLNYDPNPSEAELRPLVEWFLNTGVEGSVDEVLEKAIEPPHPAVKYVDYFIRNDGTLEDLYRKLDRFIEQDRIFTVEQEANFYGTNLVSDKLRSFQGWCDCTEYSLNFHYVPGTATGAIYRGDELIQHFCGAEIKDIGSPTTRVVKITENVAAGHLLFHWNQPPAAHKISCDYEILRR